MRDRRSGKATRLVRVIQVTLGIRHVTIMMAPTSDRLGSGKAPRAVTAPSSDDKVSLAKAVSRRAQTSGSAQRDWLAVGFQVDLDIATCGVGVRANLVCRRHDPSRALGVVYIRQRNVQRDLDVEPTLLRRPH